MLQYEHIIKKYGTPSYVFDIDTLLERVAYLREKFSLKYDLVYAVKANSFIAKKLENVVDRYEICSPGEFEICDKLKINHKKMVISGVYKDLKTLEKMIKNNDDILKYTVESRQQFDLFDRLSRKYQKPLHLLLRLTSGNQFGMAEEEIQEIIQYQKNHYLQIDGLEYFSGTQKHSIKRIQKEIDYMKEFIQKIKQEYHFEIKEIEYGPGLPVFYYQGEEFDEDQFLEEVKQILDQISNVKVSIELGRSIAASCGSYLTKVVDMKTNRYGNYVILDGGIHHLVYYGQTMAMKVPHFDVYPQLEREKNTYHLCGSLCTVNDILVKNISVRTLKKGDVFVFHKVGAYSSTEGISLFLSRDLPKVILCEQGNDILVRKSEKTSKLNFPSSKGVK